MPGVFLWGWCADTAEWVKVLVNSDGKLIIDPSEIFENPPTDGETAKAAQSDWSYDHWKDTSAHHTKYTDAEAKAAAVQAGAITDAVTKAPTHDAVYDVKVTADAALPAIDKYTDAEALAVIQALFNATTFLYAIAAGTPLPKTPTEVMAILSGQASAEFSFNGQNINIGAALLKTTNLLLKEGEATALYIRNLADDAFKNLFLDTLFFDTALEPNADAKSIQASNTDGRYLLLKARDTGVGEVEVARLQGAADPYFAAGGNQEFKAYLSGAVKISGDTVATEIAALAIAKTVKLDDFTAPDDTTDLDADAALHGLMPKASVTKLAGIATGADVTGDNAPQAHAASHEFLGNDEVRLNHAFIMGLRSFFFDGKGHDDTDLFTKDTGGTGAVTPGLMYLALSTGATNGSYVGFRTTTGGIMHSSGFYTRWTLLGKSGFQTDCDLWMALTRTDGAQAPNSGENYMGFLIADGRIWCYSCDGAVEETTDTGLDNTDGSFVINFDGTNVKFYLDGVLLATHSTRVPSQTYGFYNKIRIDNNAAANKSCRIVNISYTGEL